jgi:hypothetical protein
MTDATDYLGVVRRALPYTFASSIIHR